MSITGRMVNTLLRGRTNKRRDLKGNLWLVPADAEKTIDGRNKNYTAKDGDGI